MSTVADFRSLAVASRSVHPAVFPKYVYVQINHAPKLSSKGIKAPAQKLGGRLYLSLHLTCWRSEEHTSELQSRGHLVCRLLLEKKNKDSLTNKRTYATREP